MIAQQTLVEQTLTAEATARPEGIAPADDGSREPAISQDSAGGVETAREDGGGDAFPSAMKPDALPPPLGSASGRPLRGGPVPLFAAVHQGIVWGIGYSEARALEDGTRRLAKHRSAIRPTSRITAASFDVHAITFEGCRAICRTEAPVRWSEDFAVPSFLSRSA